MNEEIFPSGISKNSLGRSRITHINRNEIHDINEVLNSKIYLYLCHVYVVLNSHRISALFVLRERKEDDGKFVYGRDGVCSFSVELFLIVSFTSVE